MASKNEQTTTFARRRFLGSMAAGTTALLVGCGDDGGSGAGTEGSSGGTADGTEGPMTTGVDSTGPNGVSTSGDGSSTGGDTTGGEAVCEDEVMFEEAFDAESILLDETNFPYAVMAGEMKPTSVLLAVFIADAQPRTLRIWKPAAADGVVAVVAEMEVSPNADGFAKVPIDGLCPGTWYRYGYFTGAPGSFAARSIVGEFRTAPDDDALEPLAVAISACSGSSFDWPALTVTADDYYDVFLQLGDMAYNDGAFSVDEYRASWAQYMTVDGYKQAFARAGAYFTWDDHEIDDNSNFDRETMDAMQLLKRQNAMDTYFELVPIDAKGPDYRLWRSFRWGRTAEFIVLDCRYERRPSMDQYISPEQMDFLKDRLLNSPCHFKIVLNSVPITNMPGVWDVAANDRWEGYPAQRQELLDFINANLIRNVWFMSGDFHVCFAAHIELGDGGVTASTWEIAVTSGNSNPLPPVAAALNPPQFDYGVLVPRACLLLFDPEADAVNVRFINPLTGETEYDETLTQG
jgi:alkaline phosphatase D